MNRLIETTPAVDIVLALLSAGLACALVASFVLREILKAHMARLNRLIVLMEQPINRGDSSRGVIADAPARPSGR